MEVELIAYTQWKDAEKKSQDPLSIVEQAASVCYDSKPTASFRIAKACKESGHTSVLEHISFVFHVKEVSRSLLAQLTRHRHAGFSVRSQRYNSEEWFDYVNPFKADTPEAAFVDNVMFDLADKYKELKDLYDVKNEDARAILPNACCTELYISANARALIEMSYLRLCARAQAEIRELFCKFKNEISTASPKIAEWMVPQCEKYPEYPFCTEKESCGRHPLLKNVYNAAEKK